MKKLKWIIMPMMILTLVVGSLSGCGKSEEETPAASTYTLKGGNTQ